MKIGATYLGDDRCQFTVWAPLLKEVTLQLVAPEARSLPMERDEQGYWHVSTTDTPPGTRYFYQLDGEKTRPDPASQFQPQGVHEVSEVIDHSTFTWSEGNWANIPLVDYIIYELHVGLFTPEGTFESIIPRLGYLKELGVSAVEIMPVAQFPGERNWGYDGAYPFAVQNSYGGTEGLKRLVNACHQQGIAVILDVVYNHFGPEGNYTRDFAPYFTDRYNTPWGSAINFDDAYSDGVRNFFFENALYWLREFHFDALRLDAIHAIYDFGARHFLAELGDRVAALSQEEGRKFYLIAESDLNDVRVIRPKELGGYGMDAQWSDDFHHTLHTLLTREAQGYYEDFGRFEQLVKAYREGFVYAWDYSPARQRYHGSYAGDRPTDQFVVCCQNHDQVGNRMLGERLAHLVPLASLKLAAATVLLSPYIPLLFMGEEYGEDAPFLYFIDHNDPDLVQAVRAGRKREFAAFHLEGEPPDAKSVETFNHCKLNWEKRHQGEGKVLFSLYQRLIQLRCQIPALKQCDRNGLNVTSIEEHKLLSFHRWIHNSQIFCTINFGEKTATFNAPESPGNWKKQLDSSDSEWLGDGSQLPKTCTETQALAIPAQSFVLYALEKA